jgi:hypothetical protein
MTRIAMNVRREIKTRKETMRNLIDRLRCREGGSRVKTLPHRLQCAEDDASNPAKRLKSALIDASSRKSRA